MKQLFIPTLIILLPSLSWAQGVILWQVHRPTGTIHADVSMVVYSPDKVSKDGGKTWATTPMMSEGRIEAHLTYSSEFRECGAQEMVRFRDFRTDREAIMTHMETGRCRDLLIFPQNPDMV